MRSLRPSPCLQPQGQALGATLRAAVAVQIVYPDDLSLNHSHRYAFGPRIKYGAGSGTRWRDKSSAIIASIGEICGVNPRRRAVTFGWVEFGLIY